MGIPIRVLLAEDSENDALLLVRELTRAGYDPHYRRVDTASAMTEALDAETWDLVMGDYNMPHFSGPAALALVQEHGLDLPFIFVSGTIGEDVAVAAMKAGAHDYVMKGSLKRLVPAIERELREAEVRRERRRARESLLERARLSELSSDIGGAITQGASVPEILQRSADAIIRHLDAAQADIWIYGEGDRSPTRAAVAGLPPAITPSAAAAAQLRFASNDLANDARFTLEREWIAREQLTAFAGFPLVVQNRLVGLLAVFNRAPIAEVVLKALASTADTIAVGIERKQSEESLRATQARLQQLLAAGAAVIYAARVDGRSVTPTWVSENIAPILGHPPADVLAATWWADHLHPDDRARVLEEFGALNRKPQLTVEYRFRRPDGSYRWLRDESRRLIVAQGAPVEVVGVWIDITDRVHLEDQLRQSQKMEAVGRLAGGVAHDFNNLLTIITSYCDLLTEDLHAEDDRRRDLGEIRQAAEAAAGLTRQLLAFSRQQVLQPRVLDLTTVLTSAEKLLRRLIGEQVKLTTVHGRNLGAVRADPGQIEQVVMNLVVNARDAMPDGGQLTIETANADVSDVTLQAPAEAKPGPYVLLAVTDTGTGMDASTKAHIFEPFFTTKAVGKGTGLGLATVYGIVRQSGGFIWVYSELGHGTTFKIYLPRVDDAVELPAPPPIPLRSLRGTETILLVEDSAPVRAVTRQVLERQGYTVIDAESGDAAIEAAAGMKHPIHLLVTDVIMPGRSGRQTADELARVRPELKVLYMSGYTDDSVVRHGILEPGIAYLQKPFAAETLARKVREVLGMPPRGIEPLFPP